MAKRYVYYAFADCTLHPCYALSCVGCKDYSDMAFAFKTITIYLKKHQYLVAMVSIITLVRGVIIKQM